MISELVAYIEEAKAKGFAVEEIRHHLSSHGWNEYLIDYAVSQSGRRNDRKWLHGSMMAVFLIVLASATTVWWVHSPGSSASCLVESPQGSVNVFGDAALCCARIPRYSCTAESPGAQVRDASGMVVLLPDISCKTTEGVLQTTRVVLDQCAKALIASRS